MNENFIKKIIIIFLVFIVLIIITIIALIKNSRNDTQDEILNNDIEHVEEPIENPEQLFKPLADKSYYFVLKRILNNLDSCIEQVNGDWPVDPSSQFEFERTEQGIKKKGMANLKNILDELYISEFCKDEESFSNVANKYKKNLKTSQDTGYIRIIDDIYETDIDYTKILFLVDSRLNNVTSRILVKIDIESYVFSILLDEYVEKYKFNPKMNKENTNIFNNSINKSDDNSIIFDSVSAEKMCIEYVDIYKKNCKNDTEKIFSKLDEEYRKKRFSNYNTFKNWINDTMEKIDNIEVSKYNESYLDDGTLRYRILDNYNNVYTLKTKNNNILDYTIQLDDYTIPSEEFIEKYNNANEKEKVLANVQTFFKMINNKDYYSAYNVLDNNFKANNFKTLDEFKQYAQTHFYEQNVLQTSENFKKVGEYYSVATNYAESSEEGANTIQKNFIVALGQGTEFKMSFNK